jgi:hypothetical protein
MTINENLIYEGEWKEGIKHGYGRIRWPSGNIYDGQLYSFFKLISNF